MKQNSIQLLQIGKGYRSFIWEIAPIFRFYDTTMKRHILKYKNSWFTLVEVIVAITILSIIMISVISVFISWSDISAKIDIQRWMQENIKNIVETIAEDVRKNGLKICWPTEVWNCLNFSSLTGSYLETDVLYTGSSTYYLWSKTVSGTWIKVWDQSICRDPQFQCYFIKDMTDPLSNSQTTFGSLKFRITNGDVPKVTLLMKLYPAFKKWVKTDLIKNSNMIFQTTISERLIKNDM